MNDNNYKIGKDKVQRFIKLNPEDVNMGGWESPITMATKRLSSEIAKKTDETIWNAVLETNVKVDKEELIKALKYDRDQYRKGFEDGSRLRTDTIKAEVAREIFEEIERTLDNYHCSSLLVGEICPTSYYDAELEDAIAELKKKYAENME